MAPATLSSADQARLASLAVVLRGARERLHFVDYQQAERDCDLLALRLLEQIPREELRAFTFQGIPRGGLIVLGLLSYALDLVPEQFALSTDPERPVVVVDDCALTGLRAVRYLAGLGQTQLVVAHLYSHPRLRALLMAREPRLRACVAAHDLVDRAPEVFPDPGDYERWRASWRARQSPDELWHGLHEPICFAWSEPGRVFWNPVTATVEEAWRHAPPDRCLKNRADLGLPPAGPWRREWRVSPTVSSQSYDGVLWLCETASEEVFTFTGTGAAIWRALAGYGAAEPALAYLLGEYAVDEATLRRDLEALVTELIAKRLLVPAAP